MPTPCARDGKGPGHQGGLPDLVAQDGLLPTPTAGGYGTNRSPSPGAAARPSLAGLVTRGLGTAPGDEPTRSNALLPTPRGSDGAKGCPGQRGSHGDLTLPAVAVRVLPTPTVSDNRGPGGHRGGGANLRTTVSGLPPFPDHTRWGAYGAAVARWEQVLGRPVPEPSQPGRHGRPVLSPRFVEWMMGLDDGWVTDLPLPRTKTLQVLGNGVVPQQAAVALRLLWCRQRAVDHD